MSWEKVPIALPTNDHFFLYQLDNELWHILRYRLFEYFVHHFYSISIGILVDSEICSSCALHSFIQCCIMRSKTLGNIRKPNINWILPIFALSFRPKKYGLLNMQNPKLVQILKSSQFSYFHIFTLLFSFCHCLCLHFHFFFFF